MNKKNICDKLRTSVNKYLKFIWKEEENSIEEEAKDIIEDLSESLKNELVFEANGKNLRKIPILIKNFCEETLTKTLYILQEKRFMYNS